MLISQCLYYPVPSSDFNTNFIAQLIATLKRTTHIHKSKLH